MDHHGDNSFQHVLIQVPVFWMKPATLRLVILVHTSFLRKHFIEEFNHALFQQLLDNDDY